jgi:hypothetical protein
MRVTLLLSAAGLLGSIVAASPALSANPAFDITGTWAAEGKACSEAELFVEFDGRTIVAHKGKTAAARVANYSSAAVEGDRLVVNLTKAETNEDDAWNFVLDGSNRIRLDSTFFAADGEAGGLMKLTRCTRT